MSFPVKMYCSGLQKLVDGLTTSLFSSVQVSLTLESQDIKANYFSMRNT